MSENFVWNLFTAAVINMVIVHNFMVLSNKSVLLEILHRNFVFTYRIKQPNISSTDRLFGALQMCPLIERVCVISTNNSHLSSESSLINFISGAPKLVFLYVRLFTLTQAACRRIKSHISERYVCEWELHIN
jgi:Ran GTPase-activating protein (RanGAP) involved in mRNA processing and transport